MDSVCINVYSTYISIDATSNGTIYHGLGNIHKVLDKVRDVRFNKRTKIKEVVGRYYCYNKESMEFHLPYNLLTDLEDDLDRQSIPYEVKYNSPNDTSYSDLSLCMKEEWTDRKEHHSALEWLTQTDKHMVACDMQTGKGKTYCAIKAATILNKYTLVINDGLCDQWKKEFLDKTNINEEDIFIISGAPSILKLLKIVQNDFDVRPRVVIASVDTIRSWVLQLGNPYDSIISWSDFLEQYKFGLKINDEFHLNFLTLALIDLLSNLQYNIYLSATPKRSDRETRIIFDRIYPREMIGGTNVYDKYIDTVVYTYGLQVKRPQRYTTFYGYAHAKYEIDLINNDDLKKTFIDKVITSIIDGEFTNRRTKPEHKCLIFVQTVRFAEVLQQYLSYIYNDKFEVRTYTASDPIDNLYESDIIISTPKGCGTGKDIKGLITLINTVSYSSDVLCEQMFGRLRKRDDVTLKYIDVSNYKIERQGAHLWNRKRVYKSRSKNYMEHKLF